MKRDEFARALADDDMELVLTTQLRAREKPRPDQGVIIQSMMLAFRRRRCEDAEC